MAGKAMEQAIGTELQDIIVDSSGPRQFFLFDGATNHGLPRTAWRTACFEWFKQHVTHQIDKLSSQTPPSPIDVLQVTTANAENLTESRLHSSVFAVLRFVATCIASDSDVTVFQIAEKLKQKSMISSDPQRAAECCQLVFIFVGWITLLYEPNLRPRPNCLEIAHQSGPRRFPRPSTSFVYEQQTDAAAMPFRHLFPSFGSLIPQPETPDSTLHAQQSTSDSLYRDLLVVSNLHFYSLSQIGKVRVDWVKSLGQHLDFDERRQSLKLFAYPSFCAYICSDEANTTFLDRFFCDFFSDVMPSSGDEANGMGDLHSEDFFREILWSYRLIFGQHKGSWTAFKGKVHNSKDGRDHVQPPDPLLERLCGKSWRDESMFAELYAPPVKSVYSASGDFPFLGRKFLRLQDYMNAQNPSDLRTLFYDRRDILRFYTFWAVAVVGGLSIFLSLIQVLLTAVQIGITIRTP